MIYRYDTTKGVKPISLMQRNTFYFVVDKSAPDEHQQMFKMYGMVYLLSTIYR